MPLTAGSIEKLVAKVCMASLGCLRPTVIVHDSYMHVGHMPQTVDVGSGGL